VPAERPQHQLDLLVVTISADSAGPRRAPNAVETFFSALTRRRLKRGSFHSIVDLQAAIHRYIAEHNHDPKPFTWTKTPQQILAKLTLLNAPPH
jgi:hypothetical protein